MSKYKINSSTNIRPHKYTILVPKDLENIKNKILYYSEHQVNAFFYVLLQGDLDRISDFDKEITLDDFYKYQLVYEGNSMNRMPKDVMQFIQDLALDKNELPSILQNLNSLDRGNLFTNNYLEYKFKIKNKCNPELIPREHNYRFKYGDYALYHVDYLPRDVISTKSLFVVGLRQIISYIKELNNELYRFYTTCMQIPNEIDNYNIEMQIDLLNRKYDHNNFLFSYDCYEGKYIHPSILKKYLPFILENFSEKDMESGNYKCMRLHSVDFKKPLNFRGETVHCIFTRKIARTFTMTYNHAQGFITSIGGNSVLQDPCNFFGKGYSLEDKPRLTREEADNYAKEIQDFVNILGCSEKTKAYTSFTTEVNNSIKELNNLYNSDISKHYINFHKISLGKPGEIYKQLTVEEFRIVSRNQSSVPIGLEIDFINKSIIYSNKNKNKLQQTIELYKQNIVPKVKESLENIKLNINKYNNVSGEFGFSLCAYSISSTIYRMALSCYIPKEIKLEKDLSCTVYESNALSGGIIDTYVQGLIPIPLITLDVNSMYPWVMSKYPMPTSVKKQVRNVFGITLDDVLKESKESQCCIASVVVDIPKELGIGIVPYKVEFDRPKYYNPNMEILSVEETNPIWQTVNMFPSGKITTELCYHTLAYLKELQKEGFDIKVEINGFIIYNSAIYLKEFSEYLFNLRSKVDKLNVSQKIKSSIKLAQVTVYGKFASRKYNQTGKRTDNFTPNSFPAVSAHITDASRVHMHKLMRIAGFENVYYINTDGIKVNFEGYKNLKPYIDFINKPLGKLKVESVGIFEFIGKAGYAGFWINTNKPLERQYSGGAFNLKGDNQLQDYTDWYIHHIDENIRDTYTMYNYFDNNFGKDKYKKVSINFTMQDHINYELRMEYLNSSSMEDKEIVHRVSSKAFKKEFVEVILEILEICRYNVDGISNDFKIYGETLNKYLNEKQETQEIDIEI